MIGGFLFGGFFQFTNKVTSYSQPAKVEANQAMVVLTGGSARIIKAFQLMEMKKAERLLISGVHHDVSLSAIMKNNLIQSSSVECCVDLDSVAKNTAGNAVETKKWMDTKGYKSLILVTSNYHMPRSMLEFRREMPGIKLFPYPVNLGALDNAGWWKNPETLRFMISEYLQFVGSWSRDYISPKTIGAFHSKMTGQ